MNLKKEPVTIIRKSDGEYVNGHFVEGSPAEHSARANIQPLTGRELQQLPEADREKEQCKMYTAFAIANKDLVARSEDRQYEVQNVDDWSDFKQPHYKGRIVRIES